ncbi:MAG TPA: hypothetical protein VMS31_18895 [Pyrinomonadaceae bacterium]|nr:hypothetical protein [Pyrinomonadaceae bacterium]
MPFRPGKALAYAILIWLTGFIWGSIVFMTPALKRVRPIPYISSNPAISFPLLILWPLLVYYLARRFLNRAAEKPSQGAKLGLIFWLTNFLLDLVVLVVLLKSGAGYFGSLTVWIAYGVLLIVPWLTGRSLEKAE